MRCVLDCSVALAWVLPGEATPKTDKLLEEVLIARAIAPAFWDLEIANVLLVQERRSRISAPERQDAVLFFAGLPVTLEAVDAGRVWSATTALAGQHRLSVYNALYLEAALRLALPLATLDRSLAAAAKACGVTVLGT